MKDWLVYIVGNKGNMAKRYQAILNHLGVKHTGHDKDKPWFYPQDATHFLICTPTDRHIADILKCLDFEKPILCEKPIDKAHDLSMWFTKDKFITMVNQYAYISQPVAEGETYYNYFKSGADGLYWDCLNIIGLANGPVRINNTSPVWECALNGNPLTLKQVDIAYCDMLEDWLHNPVSNWDYAVAAHKKVAEMEAHRCRKS